MGIASRIGITTDLLNHRISLSTALPRRVRDAGGVPILLPPLLDALEAFLDLCDAFILSGGDDPDTRAWGVPPHPKATLIDPQRQAFELALLDALGGDHRPVLGICLGMQMMALHAGGQLDQHLPETLNSAADHWGHRQHAVTGHLGRGVVHSHHRQAIADPGRLEVVAQAHDGVIEAVKDPARHFFVGVQWHPERTEDRLLGAGVFEDLVVAARAVARGGVAGSV